MAAPVILVEATPRNPATGGAVPVRLAGGGGERPYYYGGYHWRAGLTGLPKSVVSLDSDGEQLGGGGVASALEFRWAPGGNAALDQLASLFWTDAPVVVRIGPEGDAIPPIATTGLVLETAIDGGALRIALADRVVDLNRPVLVDRFAGTGGIEGPAELNGVIKSRAWGRCFNVPGRVLVPASNIWCFGDPRRRWQAFDQVRTQGVAPDAADMTFLDWQGSPEATLAALDAAVPIDGGGVRCPSIACVKWWAQPVDLRADIRGEIEGGYVETAPAIAARIVAARSALTIAPAAIAAAAAARPAPFGWRIESDSVTASAEISELLAGVSLSWIVVGDAIVFRPWDWTASTRVARSHGVTRRKTFKPVVTRKLGYRRNWSPMARGDLAAIVLARDVVYDDGRTIEQVIAEVETTPGPPGPPGDTYYPYYAYANAPDGSVDFTTGLPAGRAYVGFATGTSPTEPTTSAAYAWAPYKGPATFGLVARGDTVVASNALVKTATTNTWGSGGGFSTDAFRGGAQASFGFAGAALMMVGLNTDPATDDSYETIDFAIHVTPSTSQVYESGTFIGDIGAWSATTRFQIVYDGARVVYYKDGAVVRTIAAAADLTLYFDAAVAGAAGAKVTSIAFQAAGSAGAAGAPGAPGVPGAPGAPGAKGRDAVVFRQDAVPATAVEGDTWVTATLPRIWRRYESGQWNEVLGAVAGLSIIDRAYIAELAVGTAQIDDLSVNTIKIKKGSVSSGGGAGGGGSFGTTWVTRVAYDYEPRSDESQLFVDVAGVITIGDLTPGTYYAEARLLDDQGEGSQQVLFLGEPIRSKLPTPFSYPLRLVGLSGLRRFRLQVRASTSSGSGDPHLLEQAVIRVLEVKR